MEVLFTLLADRYERASLLITSNLPFSPINIEPWSGSFSLFGNFNSLFF